MKVRVYALRRSGRRFHDRGQEFVRGELQLHSIMRGYESSNGTGYVQEWRCVVETS